MKILITGVAGFIGSNLAIALIKNGHNVIGVDNLSYGDLSNILELKNNKNFEFYCGDIANPLVLKEYKVELIVHLASQKIPRYSNALRTLDENYLMLKNVVNKCNIDKCRVLFASTSDVYGKNEKLPFNEESNLVLGHPAIKRWAYALSKIYGEQYIIANNEEYGLEYTITRFFGSYGPNQNLTWWGGPQSGFISNALKKTPLEIHGDGSQTRTFTYIDDAIRALMHCIENPSAINEIFNVGTNEEDEISILTLAKKIWFLVNGNSSEPLFKFVPYSSFGKYEDVLRRVPCIKKLNSYFGFSPETSLDEGLMKTIKWQKTVMNL